MKHRIAYQCPDDADDSLLVIFAELCGADPMVRHTYIQNIYVDVTLGE